MVLQNTIHMFIGSANILQAIAWVQRMLQQNVAGKGIVGRLWKSFYMFTVWTFFSCIDLALRV